MPSISAVVSPHLPDSDSNLEADIQNTPTQALANRLRKKVNCQNSTAKIDLVVLSEEQIYWETVSDIRSYVGWSHTPDFDNSSSSANDNPFAVPEQLSAGKIAVNLPTDQWICKKKLDRLSLTLVESYPSKSSEAGGLQHDQLNPRGHRVDGIGYIPTSQHPPVQFPTGTMRWPVLTALIAGLPDLQACHSHHQHPDPSHKSH